MDYNKENMRPYVGQWVRCHSVYGVHEGLVHRALHDGIIIVHTAQLTGYSDEANDEFTNGAFRPGEDNSDMQTVQFFPAPGLFVPYPGIFGIWPRVGFVI